MIGLGLETLRKRTQRSIRSVNMTIPFSCKKVVKKKDTDSAASGQHLIFILYYIIFFFFPVQSTFQRYTPILSYKALKIFIYMRVDTIASPYVSMFCCFCGEGGGPSHHQSPHSGPKTTTLPFPSDEKIRTFHKAQPYFDFYFGPNNVKTARINHIKRPGNKSVGLAASDKHSH